MEYGIVTKATKIMAFLENIKDIFIMNKLVQKHEANFKRYRTENSWNTENDLNDGTKFEVEMYSWIEVDYSTFRSFAGNRKINGKDYNGKVYYNLSLKEAVHA